jgi:hypothetical protein
MKLSCLIANQPLIKSTQNRKTMNAKSFSILALIALGTISLSTVSKAGIILNDVAPTVNNTPAISQNPGILTRTKNHYGTHLKCTPYSIKEFTQVPTIENNTNQTIAAGKVLTWQAFVSAQPFGTAHTITLTQPLAPGQTISTGVDMLAGNNSCTASTTL